MLTPVWVAGLIWSLRSPRARPFRPLALACVITIALQFVLGGKAYYPGAAFTFLLAAGCVPLERWLAERKTVPARGDEPPGWLASRIRPAAVRGVAATFWNGLGVSDDEQGAQIYIATGLRSSWAQAWPAFRDYS